MTKASEEHTDGLIDRAISGDSTAVDELMTRHRERLIRMIAVRMDSRLTSRIDPSDVVQETLAVACRRLSEYAGGRAVAFYPWLRQIAQDRLADLHRRHIQAQRRSVEREADNRRLLTDESEVHLAQRLAGGVSSPSAQLTRQESQFCVRKALTQLESCDQETLVLRYLEQLSTSEAAEALGISEDAFVQRHVRALRRLRKLWGSQE